MGRTKGESPWGEGQGPDPKQGATKVSTSGSDRSNPNPHCWSCPGGLREMDWPREEKLHKGTGKIRP